MPKLMYKNNEYVSSPIAENGTMDRDGFMTKEDKAKLDSLSVINGVLDTTNLPSSLDDIIEGYFNNGKFYKDSSHTIEITPEKEKIYVDMTDKDKPTLYYFNGTEFKKNGEDSDSDSSAASDTGSKLNLSTPSADLFGTEFTCVLEGGETIDGTFDSEGKSTVYLKYIGLYTITCIDGASTTVENEILGDIINKTITALPKATINIITDEEDFHSQTISYSGPESGSISFNIVGQANLVIRKSGTYTLSCNGYTRKVVVGAFTEDITINMKFNKYIVYGFHIDSNESDPEAAVTYLMDAFGLTPAKMNYTSGAFNYGSWEDAFFMPRPCMLKYDGTVDYYLNPNDYTKKADGTESDIANTSYAGNAMMEWGQNGTKIWIKVVPDASDATSCSVYISDTQVDSGYHAWNFYDHTNTLVDHFYTPIYIGSLIDDKIRSISGQYPVVDSVNYTDALTYATANNVSGDNGWTMETYGDRFLINMLLVLMGKSLDTQSVFGQGDNNSYNSNATKYGMTVSGTMNTKGLFWGTNGTTDGVKVFGMEHYWGNQERFLVGWMSQNGRQYVKLTYGTVDGSTTTGYNLTGDGYINTGVTASDTNGGYITKYTYGNNFGYAYQHSEGADTTYYCDYGYVSASSSIRLPYVGGACDRGTKCGAFSLSLSMTTLSAAWNTGASVSYR